MKSLREKKLVILAIFAMAFSSLANAAPLKLFGTPLAGATRSTLEPALHKAGLDPIRVGSHWWYDSYAVHGQLPGANKLLVGYTRHNRFAIAVYVFPSFVNTGQVNKVIRMVEDKYGAPFRQTGDAGLGNVRATWHEGGGMQIVVTRGWPSTTTYLKLEDVANYNRMQAEMQAQKRTHEAAESQAHSNAF